MYYDERRFHSPLLGSSPLWKTAPAGVLMQGWQNRLIILLLHRRVNHTGNGHYNNAIPFQSWERETPRFGLKLLQYCMHSIIRRQPSR